MTSHGKTKFPALALPAMLAVCGVLPCGAGEVAAQSLDEVRQAVEEVFDEAQAERLAAWGDAAVPHLVVLLQDEDDDVSEYEVFRAIEVIGTRAAVHVMVSSLERSDDWWGRTQVLQSLEEWAADPERRPLLEGERFKAAVLAHADAAPMPELLPFHEDTVGIIAHMGWTDQVPRLEALLEHPDADTRAVAAEALELLTGKLHEHDPLPMLFPDEAWDDGLVSLAGTLEDQSWLAPTFVRWGDEHRLLVPDGERGLTVLDAQLETVEPYELAGVAEFLRITPRPGGGQQLMAILDLGVNERNPGLAALDEAGETLWWRRFEDAFVEDLVPLYADGEVVGVVVDVDPLDGPRRIVAHDLSGEVLWSRRARESYQCLPRLATHPGLDGLVVVAQNDGLKILDTGGRRRQARREPERGPISRFLAGVSDAVNLLDAVKLPIDQDQALVFPGPSGGEALIVAGVAGDERTPVVARTDDDGERWTWTAALPSPVRGLALIEPTDRPRLIVATLKSGVFVVFDEHGALRFADRFAETRLQYGAHQRWVTPRALAAGRLGRGPAFLIAVDDVVKVYRVW